MHYGINVKALSSYPIFLYKAMERYLSRQDDAA